MIVDNCTRFVLEASQGYGDFDQGVARKYALNLNGYLG